MKPLSKKEWEKIKEKEELLDKVSSILKVNSSQVLEKINKLLTENDQLRNEIKKLDK